MNNYFVLCLRDGFFEGPISKQEAEKNIACLINDGYETHEIVVIKDKAISFVLSAIID